MSKTSFLATSEKHSFLRVRLYRVVFSSRPVVFCALLLVASLLLQPIENALAFDESSVSTEAVAESVSDGDAGAGDTAADESPADTGSVADDGGEVAATNPESQDTVVVTEPSEIVVESHHEEDTSVSVTHSDLEAAPVAVDAPDITGSGGEEGASTSEAVIAATTTVATSTLPTEAPGEAVSDNPGIEVATTTGTTAVEIDAMAPTPPESVDDLVPLLENMESLPQAPINVEGALSFVGENHYQFAKDDCVAVGNGNYHCALTSETAVSVVGNTGVVVYAAPDTDGDQEIFLKTNTETEQITHNELDDTAPQLDLENERIVWQRLIDGRSQILQYDIRSATEKQLTAGRQNNMQPATAAGRVVWQQWDGNDWEIMLYDGTTTERISANEVPDLSPVLEEDYVVWTTIMPEGQYAQVYSLTTHTTKTITDHEGGTIANPRFVLVYDTKFENGDITTHTFDPASGVSMPVASTPAPTPVNIPPVEPTGETKALVQSKPAQKEDGLTESDDDTLLSPSASGTVGVNASTTTETAALDLIVGSEAATTTEVIPAFELTDYDLIITEFSTSSAQQSVSE